MPRENLVPEHGAGFVPTSCAANSVPSVLPLSATMTSPAKAGGIRCGELDMHRLAGEKTQARGDEQQPGEQLRLVFSAR
jgi:hypothetical protein